MWLNVAILLVGAAGGSAPAQQGTDSYADCVPGSSRLLKLDVSVEPTIVVPTSAQDREPRAPHTSKVRVTVTNPASREVRLTFPDPCYLGFEVEAADGRDVPREDAEMCASALAELTLAAGASHSKEFRWTARTRDHAYVPLRPGKYTIAGTLAKRYCGAEGQEEPPLRTAPVAVEVRPAAN